MEQELIELIAKEMYEVGNEGVFSKLREQDKELWRLDAGYIAESILKKWSLHVL